jgi:hypothetical protein
MLKRVGLLALLFLAVSITAMAQTGSGTIKGFVYDKSSGEPMIYTIVALEGTKMGVQTDVNGYFSLKVPEGTYTLITTSIGYDTMRTLVTVANAAIVTKKLLLRPRDRELENVSVSTKKTEKITLTKVGNITVTPKEMKMMPSAGGEPDIAQYLQVTPGVVFTGDQGGQLYIRGGAPSQTGILLDGITIYNPFHSIGLYSVFETDAIRNVDIYTAGFGAEYGNRTSAILDVRTKDGNKNRLSGKVSVSPIMARALLEGPLAKSKKEDGSATTFLLSVKQSYLNQTSTGIYGGFGEPYKSGLPYSFTDLYGKVTFSASNGSKLNLFGFNFDDKAKIFSPGTSITDADFHWVATGGGATFVVSPGSSDVLISGKFAYSRYNMDYNEANYAPRNSLIDGFESGIYLTYFMKGYSQLKYGLEVSGNHTTLSYFNALGNGTNLDRRNTLASAFFTYRKNFEERFILDIGLRAQYYAALSNFSPEPRVSMKYNATHKLRFKAAAGLYSQNILSTKSDRDIVNFFNGFILSPDATVQDLNGNDLKNNLQKSYHLIAGAELDVKNVELNLEPWYKNFYQNIELNRNKINATDPDFQGGKGSAYGIDLSAKYQKRSWYLWGVVSYQKVTYKTIDNTGAVQTYAPPFDRRFNVNLIASYTLGKKKAWELSARYNLGTPLPFTQTQGFYENLGLTSNGIGTNYLQQNGSVNLIYANEINGGRLSYYHRLDISVKRKFELNKNSNLEAAFSVSNVYNRNNIFYIDRIANTRVYQLPLFPSLNLTWNF